MGAVVGSSSPLVTHGTDAGAWVLPRDAACWARSAARSTR